MLKMDAHFALDPAKAETFAATLLTALNHAALCLMMSIGHRTGLFDVMSGMPPSSSREIAAAAGLHERYVREWLGGHGHGTSRGDWSCPGSIDGDGLASQATGRCFFS
jgi:hypothetical protein